MVDMISWANMLLLLINDLAICRGIFNVHVGSAALTFALLGMSSIIDSSPTNFPGPRNTSPMALESTSSKLTSKEPCNIIKIAGEGRP